MDTAFGNKEKDKRWSEAATQQERRVSFHSLPLVVEQDLADEVLSVRNGDDHVRDRLVCEHTSRRQRGWDKEGKMEERCDEQN